MNIRFIKSSEKKKIIENLNEQFGIKEIPYLLIESGKEKVRAFSGHMSKEEISEISQILNIESLGIYFAKEENQEFRLSFDACILMQDQIKNHFSITDEEFKLWIRGQDLQIKSDRGTKVIKYKEDNLGCGKSNGEKIFNYVPKDRRLRK